LALQDDDDPLAGAVAALHLAAAAVTAAMASRSRDSTAPANRAGWHDGRVTARSIALFIAEIGGA
jgi:hypothetical protein